MEFFDLKSKTYHQQIKYSITILKTAYLYIKTSVKIIAIYFYKEFMCLKSTF